MPAAKKLFTTIAVLLFLTGVQLAVPATEALTLFIFVWFLCPIIR